jgi:hypothetical protein
MKPLQTWHENKNGAKLRVANNDLDEIADQRKIHVVVVVFRLATKMSQKNPTRQMSPFF